MKNENNLSYLIVFLLGAIIVMQFLAVGGMRLPNQQTVVVLNRSQAQQNNAGYITLTASGSARGVPESGMLSVAVDGKGSTAYAATYNLSRGVSQLNATILKYIDGKLSNIATTSYNLYNQSDYYYTSYNGYVASERFSITIPNINNASAVLGSLSSINGVSVSGLAQQFSKTQLASLRTIALQRALSNASEQAQELLPGRTLVAKNISVNYYNPIVVPFALSAVPTASSGATNPRPGYFTGMQTVTGSVSVVFAYNYS